MKYAMGRTIFEDMKAVSVYCSASYCRFKKNDAYYNLCHNVLVINEHFSFMGGEVYIDGSACKCPSCNKEKCPLSDCEVSNTPKGGEKSDEFIFIYPER